ncbi:MULTISPECIES: alpha/beta hydrolase [unclassified Leptolyngbya]|uniref:alpha/beta hydrolase n=1 Tax=unclassified Leptolyngbya TaxID=2650499 RepID=UPI0016841819|nr:MULTISPECIES: alpha/beta hydrolase [unclassified Leptolyngbya]MBD1913354.1 alpha/beta hydrolase [Leptolyngbya sp. FACHB-8]MBD2158715.1 alpha/beta hydrolase [Leptolyngbya sp. FACHB-16]
MSKSHLKKLLIGELSWRRFVRSLLFIYAFFAVYVFFRADSMIFLPQPSSYQDSNKILKLPVTPDERISATYLPNPKATYTLLYIHGNAEDLGDVQPILDRLQEWGFNVFAYDYRGYGTSTGKPGERNAYQDAEAAYNYLTQQLQVPPDRIIVYGRSVGGGSATELATRHSVAGLILESTFTSAFQVVLPIPLLPFDKFSNRQKLQRVDCPVLVIHGEADETIPVAHGRALYEAAAEPKLSLWVEGAGHDDVTWVAGDRHHTILQAFQKLLEQ